MKRFAYLFLLAIAANAQEKKPTVYVMPNDASADIIQFLAKKCPQVAIKSNKDSADYTLIATYPARMAIAVFRNAGDILIHSSSVAFPGNAVNKPCKAILKDAGLK